MVKKIFKWVLKIIIFILVYLLQIYVVNNTMFFGVNGDLCLMAVVLTSLMENGVISYITAGLCGVASDLLFSSHAMKYIVIYLIITAVLLELKRMYKQDSKIAIIIFSVAATVASEIIMLMYSTIGQGDFVNAFSYMFMIIKESIINICLAYVLYLAFKLCKQEG